MTVKTIKQAVLRKIKPTAEEENKVGAFTARLLSVTKTVSKLEGAMCGSIGKHTWLRGDHDVDLFIMFPASASRDELEKKGLEFGKQIAKQINGATIIKYAEHPYLRARTPDFLVDIVPCYRIAPGEKIKSAVDRSPLHRDYVLKKLPAEFRDEVRLVKQFCKGAGVYGSDAKNRGFSGYTCELLAINYGKLENLLKAAAAWKPPVKIDIENAGTASKFADPLVIVDPVDPERNVAANLGAENFVKFVRAAVSFIARPDDSYFSLHGLFLGKEELQKLKERGTLFAVLKMKKPDVIEDTLYPQLRKTAKRIEAMLEKEEFSVLRSFAFSGDDMCIIMEMNVWQQPPVKKMPGPEIFSAKHVREFTGKYGKSEFPPYIEENQWFAEKQRQFRDAVSLLKGIVSKKPEELAMPTHIAKPLHDATLLQGDEFWKTVTKHRELSAFLRRKYFEKLA
ncbi:MAG: CCA tRNA nucleotidyltransferase [Candidatus Aenigmarchaeota archaeon]|nr:CCA tRNA nucleotidyltransferase [Candidatus Aenigmarchaeota archaeon]